MWWMQQIIEKYQILKLAISAWFKGDSWEDAVWYAETIVKGWRNRNGMVDNE